MWKGIPARCLCSSFIIACWTGLLKHHKMVVSWTCKVWHENFLLSRNPWQRLHEIAERNAIPSQSGNWIISRKFCMKNFVVDKTAKIPSSKQIFVPDCSASPWEKMKNVFIKFHRYFCCMQENRFLRLLNNAAFAFLRSPLERTHPPRTFPNISNYSTQISLKISVKFSMRAVSALRKPE